MSNYNQVVINFFETIRISAIVTHVSFLAHFVVSIFIVDVIHPVNKEWNSIVDFVQSHRISVVVLDLVQKPVKICGSRFMLYAIEGIDNKLLR